MRPLLVVAALAAVLPGTAAPLSAQENGDNARGAAVYDRWCASCHGVEGAGDGPAAAYMLPRPRDFTRALYQIRTTASGEVPTDADILRIIDEGMPGTVMPGWEDVLQRADREALVPYLKSFSRFFAGQDPEPMDFGRAPRGGDEAVERGAEVYQRVECWQCHGQAGRGDGTSAPTLEDDGGQPIYAADLTANWTFNGGGSVEEIYRRLRTGLDGTPMPTFDDLISAGIVDEDGLWDLAHYVRSLAPER
ncbi:MAG: cytochrome c, partial [Gemmatimonadetes bacterium]|nr:cytochrome c [Gemmatimonadota bacterium]